MRILIAFLCLAFNFNVNAKSLFFCTIFENQIETRVSIASDGSALFFIKDSISKDESKCDGDVVSATDHSQAQGMPRLVFKFIRERHCSPALSDELSAGIQDDIELRIYPKQSRKDVFPSAKIFFFELSELSECKVQFGSYKKIKRALTEIRKKARKSLKMADSRKMKKRIKRK